MGRCEDKEDSRAFFAMNKYVFLTVFLLGAATALVAIILNDFVKLPLHERPNVVSPLPDESHITVVDESGFVFGDRPQTQVEKPKSRDVSHGSTECEATEALQTVSAAVNSMSNKAINRAKKLFKHALVLCPKHPKVLNHYGEFLETIGEDLIEADHMFVRASSFAQRDSEDYTRALQNRRRTAVLVEEIDGKLLKHIDAKKNEFQKISGASSALRRAKKEAYFQHIYHTVGIEGNTMSLAQTRSVLETKLAVAGKSIIEHNEVLGLDAALRYLNQTLVDKVGEITLEDILGIHKRVIGFVDPIEAGLIRQTQVYVGDYAPPPASHIEVLLQRFILWLNAPEQKTMHPIRLAALAHYKLVYIHPFIDGNGRTSRLLMNLILMQNGFPPVIIRKQDRLLYYQHLVTANEGDIRPFIRFIAECTERTLDAYLAATKETKNSLKTFNFNDDADATIPAQDHLDYHDQIIMGGMVGHNITVAP